MMEGCSVILEERHVVVAPLVFAQGSDVALHRVPPKNVLQAMFPHIPSLFLPPPILNPNANTKEKRDTV